MNICDLENRDGEVADLLGIERIEGVANLSQLDWESPLIVLRGLTFDNVLLQGVKIRPNLVECRISDSCFIEVESYGHFWGAGNNWYRCHFSRIRMEDVIAPQCRFCDCSFDDVCLTGFRMCETVFANCSFNRVTITAMSARERRHLQPFPELDKTGASGLFSKCTLEMPCFENCQFDQIAFNGCKVSHPVVSNCNFSGIISDGQWWHNSMSCDLFIAFLDDALKLIEGQLGRHSVAFSSMQRFRDEYVAGRSKSRDYSACLFEGNIPYADLQKIEKGLEKLESRYSL